MDEDKLVRERLNEAMPQNTDGGGDGSGDEGGDKGIIGSIPYIESQKQILLLGGGAVGGFAIATFINR